MTEPDVAAPGSTRLRNVIVAVVAALVALAGVFAGITSGGNIVSPHTEPNCPTAEKTESDLSVVVSNKNQHLSVDSTLTVTLTKPTPRAPNRTKFDQDRMGDDFVRCFLDRQPTAKLTSSDWSDGKLVATFTLPHSTHVDPRADRPIVVADLGLDASVNVDLCAAPRRQYAPVCAPAAQTRIAITVTGLAEDQSPSAAQPFPHHIGFGKNSVTYRWNFTGPAPAVSASIDVPAVASMVDYLTSSGAYHPLLHWPNGQFALNTNMLAFLVSALTMLLSGVFAMAVRRDRVRVLTLAVAAVLLHGVNLHWYSSGHGYGIDLGSCLIATLGWTLVIGATARRRLAVTAALLLGACVALGAMILLMPSPRQTPVLELSILAALLAMLVIGVIVVFRLAIQVFELRDDNAATDYQFRNSIAVLLLVGLCYALAFVVGSAMVPDDSGGPLLTRLAVSTLGAGQAFAIPLRELAPLLIGALLVTELVQGRWTPTGDRGALRLALLFVLAAPWSSLSTGFLAALVPLWLVQLLVVGIGVRTWLSRPDQRDPSTAAQWMSAKRLLRIVRDSVSRPGPAVEGVDGSEAGRVLLERGLTRDALSNARSAATYAGYLAVLPVLYFIWTTLDNLSGRLQFGFSALLVVLAILLEAARWVVTGFVFGYLYPRLPGRIGPVKALWFAGLWTLGCLAPTAIARGLDLDMAQQFVYRSAQLALFVIVLGVIVDGAVIRRAGGGLRDIRSVYALQNYGEITAAVAPALLLTVTLTQQILAGSGFDVAESFLSGLGSVFGNK